MKVYGFTALRLIPSGLLLVSVEGFFERHLEMAFPIERELTSIEWIQAYSLFYETIQKRETVERLIHQCLTIVVKLMP
jgi:hypothetical protein